MQELKLDIPPEALYFIILYYYYLSILLFLFVDLGQGFSPNIMVALLDSTTLTNTTNTGPLQTPCKYVMPNNTIQYNIIQYNTIQYNTKGNYEG